MPGFCATGTFFSLVITPATTNSAAPANELVQPPLSSLPPAALRCSALHWVWLGTISQHAAILDWALSGQANPTLLDGGNLINLEWFRADFLESRDEAAHSESLLQDPELVLSGRPPPLSLSERCVQFLRGLRTVCAWVYNRHFWESFLKSSSAAYWLWPVGCQSFVESVLCVTGDLLCRYASGWIIAFIWIFYLCWNLLLMLIESMIFIGWCPAAVHTANWSLLWSDRRGLP